MATKPSSILGYNPLRTNCITIPVDKMATGFLPGEKPPAQYLGDLFERIDRWLEYVKDGAWTGNTTITGTLGVTGATSVTGTLSASGLITATAGLTAAVNQHVTVSGTGRFRHGEFEISIAGSEFNVNSGTGKILGPSTLSTFVPDSIFPLDVYARVVLPVGKRITRYQQFYNVNGTAANVVPLLRRVQHTTGTTSAVASGAGDATGSAIESQTISSINHTVEAGYAYYAAVEVNAAAQRVHGVTIWFDDP
jgi:hypothetical protein